MFLVERFELLHVHNLLRLKRLGDLFERDDRLSVMHVAATHFILKLLRHHVLLKEVPTHEHFLRFFENDKLLE